MTGHTQYNLQPMAGASHATDRHIKPTTVTADEYLQHQSNKNCNIKIDSLAEILNTINRNLAVYTNRQPINKKSLQQEAKAIEQCSKRADTSHKEGEGIP